MNTQTYTQDEATDFDHADSGRRHALSQAQLNALMAQVRDRQLRYAQRGEVIASARFAQRASTLRAAMNQMARVSAAAALLLLLLPVLVLA